MTLLGSLVLSPLWPPAIDTGEGLQMLTRRGLRCQQVCSWIGEDWPSVSYSFAQASNLKPINFLSKRALLPLP